MHAFTNTNFLKFNELLQAVEHTRKIKKGAYLFQKETIDKELFVIISGKVQIT